MFGLPKWMSSKNVTPTSDSPAAVAPPVAAALAAGKRVDETEAKRVLAEAGIADPLELTPAQQASQERSREMRKLRVMPTQNDIAATAFRRVTQDFYARQEFRAESARLRTTRVYDAVSLAQTSETDSAEKLIRRQRHTILLEQSTSITAVYLQAAAFMLASATSAMVAVLSVVAAKQMHSMFLGLTPFSSFAAWRSWDAYESVAEEVRFLNQAREIRDVKRAHLPEQDFKLGELTPLEQKRRARKAQQEAEAKAALERVGLSSAAGVEKASANAAAVTAVADAIDINGNPVPKPAATLDDGESMGPEVLNKWKDQQLKKKQLQEEKFNAAAAKAREGI